jgi:hypothetical protein
VNVAPTTRVVQLSPTLQAATGRQIEGCGWDLKVSSDKGQSGRSHQAPVRMPTTEAWFDGNLQKICSIAASIVTAEFKRTLLPRGWKLWQPASVDDGANADLQE